MFEDTQNILPMPFKVLFRCKHYWHILCTVSEQSNSLFPNKTCELQTVIDGHHGTVNASKFCPTQDSLLVTISEDRTFKVQLADTSMLIMMH